MTPSGDRGPGCCLRPHMCESAMSSMIAHHTVSRSMSRFVFSWFWGSASQHGPPGPRSRCGRASFLLKAQGRVSLLLVQQNPVPLPWARAPHPSGFQLGADASFWKPRSSLAPSPTPREAPVRPWFHAPLSPPVPSLVTLLPSLVSGLGLPEQRARVTSRLRSAAFVPSASPFATNMAQLQAPGLACGRLRGSCSAQHRGGGLRPLGGSAGCDP